MQFKILLRSTWDDWTVNQPPVDPKVPHQVEETVDVDDLPAAWCIAEDLFKHLCGGEWAGHVKYAQTFGFPGPRIVSVEEVA